MPKPSRKDIYEAVIRRMVAQALEVQETAFTKAHAPDSDEQLIAYIREQAASLQYTPRYKEIIGWQLICRRFGSWEQALERCGLEIPQSCPAGKLPRIQREVEKQKEAYRQKKAEKKLRAQRRIQARGEKNKQE